MKKYLSDLSYKSLKWFILGLTLLAFQATAWETKKVVEKVVDPDTVKTVRWEGETDLDMLKQVRSDLDIPKDSKVKTLYVNLLSPGGPVVTSLEIARLVREAHDKNGLTVEIHASALCASGCTFVLASGTPGSRYIAQYTLFLVHSIQAGGGWGPAVCVEHSDEAKSQEDKARNILLDIMRDSYVRYTKTDPATAEKWLTCGNEQVGQGDLAVTLGFADKVE